MLDKIEAAWENRYTIIARTFGAIALLAKIGIALCFLGIFYSLTGGTAADLINPSKW